MQICEMSYPLPRGIIEVPENFRLKLKYILRLDDSRTSMPALARPCTSGVETSKHMQVTCWHCGCLDHYECVDNQYLSPYRIGGKWLPWFLRKSRPFIFKYRPLGPTYFNIWGIFTIVGIFLIKWYNIPLMQFASLTLEGAHPLIMPTTDFHQKNWKIKFFIFFKIIQYPFDGIFQINFCVRVPLNDTKNHFHKKKIPKNRFLFFVIKWYNIPLMQFASPWGPSSLNHADNRFSSKNWKINFFNFFFKIIQYPFYGSFQINFCVRVPLNNTKTIFTRKKPEQPIFIFLS